MKRKNDSVLRGLERKRDLLIKRIQMAKETEAITGMTLKRSHPQCTHNLEIALYGLVEIIGQIEVCGDDRVELQFHIEKARRLAC